METMTAQQAMEKLEKYKKAAEFEENIYDAELHNACISALNKQLQRVPRKTTIFEGEQAEKLAAKGLKNYETYKCPVCNWIVADRKLTGFKISNFCENCGQALETNTEIAGG